MNFDVRNTPEGQEIELPALEQLMKMGYDEEPSMGNPTQENSEDAKLKSKYNEAVSKYIDACVETCYLELYIQNITETSSYDLTPQQAAVLQF